MFNGHLREHISLTWIPRPALTLGVLRWLTVVVPLAFLVAVDYIRHFVYPQLLHPFSGYLFVLAGVSVAILFFSFTIFGIIERMQTRILNQNRELGAISETAQRQAAQLRALHEAGLALVSDLGPKTVLQRGVDLARGLVGARYGAAAVLGERDIAYFLTSGLNSDESTALGEPPRGQGLLRAVMAAGYPIRVDGISKHPESIGFPPSHPPMTTFLGVPIVAKGRTLGALYLTDKTAGDDVVPFSPQDEEVLQLFAQQAAAALENARLHSTVESLAATAERERIARELHDSLAQALGFVGVRAQAAQMALATGDLAEVRQGLGRIRSVSEAAYADVREAILGLRSGIGADRDLAQSLREYVERYRHQSRIHADLEIVGGADRLSLAPTAEVQLLRIIQEALANVRKHARAKVARIKLEQADLPGTGLVLRVTVEDDGQGFDPAAASGVGAYGLATMRERAEGIGGRLTIHSAPGSGTRIVVELPALGIPVALGELAERHQG
ncbi:MAG: GAF domain-containing sensor histidine kinase [Chloroflexi bacterium]|nr:GAF domain-containing sensor histidine kinase [Chloroflexota bacterium]